MDYPQKVELITNLKFLDMLESFQMKYKDTSDDGDLEEQEEE